MKRMTRTLTAAALSGALALGGTAVASAQTPAPTTTSALAPEVDMASTGESTAPSSVDYPLNGEFDKKKLAWLALPAALVIGGVTWYLAKDGKTYVKSEEAAQKSELSAEEKAESEQLLKDNHDEVIAQGGKVAQGQGAADAAQEPQVANRGISAETGSNTVARGLAALAIAAMLAAGAVVARRKQLF